MAVLQHYTGTNNYRGLRAGSLQLAQFLRNDFASMAGEIESAFPSLAGRVHNERTASLFARVDQSIKREDVPLRYLPIVRRIARELATLYAQPPRRDWVDSGERNGPLVDVYRRQGIDRLMHETQRSLIMQQTQILLVLPGGPDGFRVLRYDPYDVEVIAGNPLYAGDIQQAERVRVSVPIVSGVDTVEFGVMEMTRDSIRWAGSNGGPFGEGGRNPFGQTDRPYPIAVIRSVEPDHGVFYAPVNDPVRQAQIGINLALTDIERVLRFDAHGLKVLTPGPEGNVTQGMADGVPFSVDSLIALPGFGTDLKVVGGQMGPMIQAYVNYIQRYLEWLAVFLDMSPDALMKSNAAKTAVSRKFDRMDRSEKRQEYEPIMQRAESDLYREIVRVAATRGVNYPDASGVRVEWSDTRQIPADPLAEAQALQQRMALGIDSPVEAIRREQGVSRERARTLAAQYRDDAAPATPQPPAQLAAADA